MKVMQALLSDENDKGGDQDTSDNQNASGSDNEAGSADSGGFGDMFGNIDFETIMKMGEVFSQMSRPDENTALLVALKPHLSPEKRHKVDTALKLSRMMSLLPFIKDSGILRDLF
ncbi:MAG: hypothetical protein FWD34_06735 [Oscillospiraceae bacterium]|nr:hypothetical protein [Oscillospiraceae bacterium]